MSILGLEVNDAGIALADANRLVSVSPGYAWMDGGRVIFGEPAWREIGRHPRDVQNRYWRNLDESVLSLPGAAELTAADLVHAHLQEVLSAHVSDTDSLLVAVPAYWSKDQLGLFLGIVEELSIPVVGLIDASVAATRCHYTNANVIHIDSSLHETTLTRIEQDGQAAVGSREISTSLGVAALERHCVEFFSRLFVEQSRFDPLHDASTEQTVCVSVYDWLARLAKEKTISVQIESGAHAYEAKADYGVYSEQLTQAVEPFLQQLRGMLAADRATAIQLNGHLMRFPGLADSIAGLARVHLFSLEVGAGATGAASRARPFGDAPGHRLHKRIPWDLPVVEVETSASAETEKPESRPSKPTHAVIGGRAYRLGRGGFQFGTELSEGEYGFRVERSHGGVSRRHCAIIVGPRGVELVDQSRHGTALNGHQIDGSAMLEAGDTVTFGSPSIQVQLVSEVGHDGA